jgi:MraZ protein
VTSHEDQRATTAPPKGGETAPAGPRFTGRYPGKIDTKGRALLPPVFRQKVDGGSFSFFPSMTEPAVMIGGPTLYDDLLDLVLGIDEFEEDRFLLEQMISQRLIELSPDETGRVVLPRTLVEHAGIDGAAGFAGRGGHFVLAAAGYLDDLEAQASKAADRYADIFKARMLPSVSRGRRR